MMQYTNKLQPQEGDIICELDDEMRKQYGVQNGNGWRWVMLCRPTFHETPRLGGSHVTRGMTTTIGVVRNAEYPASKEGHPMTVGIDIAV